MQVNNEDSCFVVSGSSLPVDRTLMLSNVHRVQDPQVENTCTKNISGQNVFFSPGKNLFHPPGHA